MRSRGSTTRGRRVAALVTAGLAVGALSGCGAPPHPLDSASPTSPPTESPAGPTFATPEAAFEAAVATYQRYVDLLNIVGADGGSDPDRLREVFTDGDLADEEVSEYEDLRSNGLRVEGSMTFDKAKLVQYQDDVDLIQMYVCFDISGTKLIDSAGSDVTPERESLTPLLVTFTITAQDRVRLRDSEQWDGPGVC
jgi:hypothetical protein